MIVLKGTVEHQPVEFDGNTYSGADDVLFSKTAEEMIELMKSIEMLPLKVGEKLIIEAVEMSESELESIPEYNG